MKRQGTNDQRALEGKGKQSQGNAIERLGKILIGFRSALQYERIMLFDCFGWGIDFAPGQSILDRVIPMKDRKSVVSGKRESVRVYRSGRGVIKRKSNKQKERKRY